MKSIKHQLTIESTVEKVFEALTTIEGLSGWWTVDTIGSCELGDALYFTFGEYAIFEFQVALLDTNKLVSWKFVGGNPEWDKTYITFLLEDKGGKVDFNFVHEDFEDDYEGFSRINDTWEIYLNSLKDYCETGVGQPFQE